MTTTRYWQASGESLKTSIRTKTRLSQLTEEGYYTGGSIAFGYKRVRNGRMNKRNREVYDLAIDEDEAEIVRLIFHKYADEGYGALRISNYLHEHNITGRGGKNFPNVSVIRMIKNRMYAGFLINGDSQAECPELRIIDLDLFERAQDIRQKRTKPHNEIPLNCKSKALLVGRIYCGHCGNRLTLTTGGRKRVRADGSVNYETRMRYQCHYNVRHPGECDGQSGYGVTKLDTIVDQIIRMKFSEIKAASRSALLASQQKKEVEQARAKAALTASTYQGKKKEVSDLRAETIKVIRGESKLDADLLNSLVAEASSAMREAEKQQEAAQQELDELLTSAKKLEKEYDQILTWADLYESASFEAKKMIVLQFIKSVRVYRDYEIDLELNVSFEEFKGFQPKASYFGESFLTDEQRHGNYIG